MGSLAKLQNMFTKVTLMMQKSCQIKIVRTCTLKKRVVILSWLHVDEFSIMVIISKL